MLKKNNLVLISVVLIIVGGLIYLFTSGKDKGAVIAKVNGVSIYDSEIEAQVNALNPMHDGSITFSSLEPKAQEMVIRQVAAHKLLSEQKENVEIDMDDVNEKVDAFKENLIKDAVLQAIGQQAVTEESLAQHYAQLQSELEGKVELNLQHILLPSEKEAKKVVKELSRGKKSFEQIAKDKSIDKATGENGGNLGYAVTNLYVKEFADAAASLKKGNYTKEPVKTQFGWHVIKLLDSRPAKVLPFDQIKNRLANDISKQAMNQFIQDLVNNAEIEIIEPASKEQQAN